MSCTFCQFEFVWYFLMIRFRELEEGYHQGKVPFISRIRCCLSTVIFIWTPCLSNIVKFTTGKFFFHTLHLRNMSLSSVKTQRKLGSTSWMESYQTICALNENYHSNREEAMAPHSSTVARKIPWTEEPGGLQSMGSLRVRHD